MSNKSVALSVVAWLENQKDGDYEDAVKSIQAGFDLNESDFLEKSYYPAELSSIFEAGVEKLSLKTAGDNLKDAQSDENFDAFVSAVTEKGFFKNVKEGSMDYLQRQAKLTRKFLDKSRTTSDASSLEACAEGT